MALFSKKSKEVFVRAKSYYKCDGELYLFELNEYIDKKDSNLSNAELFNKYGVAVSRYSLVYSCFADWEADYYSSFDEAIVGDTIYELVKPDDLEVAIQNIENDFKKKFEDFELDGTVYTRISPKEPGQCFRPIVKPKAKLVDTKGHNSNLSLILEVEVLDGKDAQVKYEFMPFYEFVNNYNAGCNVKILESLDNINIVEDYFLW